MHRVSNENFALRRSQWFGIGVLGLLMIALAVVLFGVIQFDYKDGALLALLTLIFLVNGSLAYSRLRDFRRIRVQMEGERKKLEETNMALKQVDGEL